MITRIAGKSLVSMRAASTRFGSFPARQCHRKVEDRTKWNRQTRPKDVPSAEKSFAKQALDYWRPMSKNWRVFADPKHASAPVYAGLFLVTGIPLLYLLWRRRDKKTLQHQPDPKANKSPFTSRPELATMRNVKHDVAGCPNGDVKEVPEEAPVSASLKRPAPPKLPKPCLNVKQSETDMPCEVMTNTAMKDDEGVPESIQVASAPSL